MLARIAICAALLTPLVLAAEKLSAPQRITQTSPGQGEYRSAVWSRGYLFHEGWDRRSLTVYSTAGEKIEKVLQATIQIEEARVVRIDNMAAGPSNIFAACGLASVGAQPGPGFISIFGPGRPQVTVPLKNVWPHQIVFADDGTLWASVREFDSGPVELKDYDLLRHYSSNGKLLGSSLPRSALGTTGPNFGANLSASHDTIGAYFNKAGVWAEVSYNGSVKGCWRVSKIWASKGQTVWSDQLQLTDSNQVIRVSSMSYDRLRGHTNQVRHLFKVRASLESSPVDAMVLADVDHVVFWGVDGDQFVWWAPLLKSILWNSLQATHHDSYGQ